MNTRKNSAHNRIHPGRRGNAVSLAPMTGDQALAALLKVKPADVAKLEAAEGKAKKRKSRRG